MIAGIKENSVSKRGMVVRRRLLSGCAAGVGWAPYTNVRGDNVLFGSMSLCCMRAKTCHTAELVLNYALRVPQKSTENALP
jgi:hypothetical protein